jgi:hypothetical protein
MEAIVRSKPNHLATFERLEDRRLFSVLDDLHGVVADRVETSAPSLTAGRDLRKTQMRVDADLLWLANNVAEGERPALRKADSALLTLYSRARRGIAGSALGQLVEGVDLRSTHIVRGDGVPLVNMTVTDVDEVRPRLEALGVQVAGAVDKPSWQLIDAFVPIGKVLEVSQLPGVKSMHCQRRPHVNRAGAGNNQWDAISGAAQYRSIFTSITGGGIDFGVMSDSIDKVGNGVAGSQASGDLPPGNRVTILDDGGSNDTDEGRAMAEEIIDLAPGADILFHTAGGGITNFANGIDDLRAAGADVIVDDIGYANDPAFQDGAIAQAIDDAVLNHDVLYFSAAGNENNSSVLDTFSNPDGDDFHNFSNGGEIIPIRVAANTKTEWYLQFDDPWGSAGSNWEIQVFDFDGGVVGDLVKGSNDDNTPLIGNGDPFDDVTINNNDDVRHDYALSIKHLGGNSPAGQRLFLFNFDGNFTALDSTMNNEPSVYGHSNARWGFGIGAVPQSNPSVIESFSSLGGVPVVFDDAGNAITPVFRDNPAFVAADGVATTLNRFNPFFGTSAAAPNAAAIAGLMMEAHGGARSLSWTQFRDMARDTAVDLGAAGYDTTFGHGRIDGLVALFAAKGPGAGEVVVELNQFGRATLEDRTLTSVTDVDRFFFAPDNDGSAVVSVNRPAASLNAGLAFYDQEAGTFLSYNDDAVGASPALVAGLSARKLYQAEVFGETGTTSNSDYDLSVVAPAPAVGEMRLDDHGDGLLDSEIGHADSDYWRVTVPGTASALGDLVLTLDPASGLDGVVTVFDGDGNQVRRRDAAGAGGAETVTIADVQPGAEYVVRVAGVDYATEGAYTLSAHVDVDLPPTFTAAQAQGTAIFNHDGVASSSSDFDLNINTAGDVDSLVFAGNSGWTGPYQVTVRAPLLGDLFPVIGVYDGATGALIQTARPSGPVLTNTATLTFDGTGLAKYVLAVADAGANNTGDLTFTITAPGSNAGTALVPDALGDAALEDRVLSPQADSDFYRFTVPAGVTGGRLTVFPGNSTFDGLVGLFDDAGAFIGSADAGAPGAEEVMNFSGLVPGQTYRVTVLPDQHDSSGAYALVLDLDVPVGSLRGKVFEDVNGDGVHDANEPGLALWNVFADLNGNGVYDKLAGGQEEPHALSAADGSYAITGVPVGSWDVREDPQLGWVQSAPEGGAYAATIAGAGDAVSGLHFGNYRPASLPVRSWQDDDADGIVDAGEAPLPGRQVWVDYDGDGVFDGGSEPFILTGAGGAGTIVGIRPGSWPVRERLPDRTWLHTEPAGGAPVVSLVSGQAGGLLRFGSYQPMDFGDAPASYGTTVATGGAAHFARSPWFLGRYVDTELDGMPSVNADGDDAGGAPDDEDGVRFLTPLARGLNAQVLVRASRRGRLNGWIDLNGDGDFLDAGDFVLANVAVPGAGAYTFNIPVPAGATLGDTYARFRFNQAGGIGPVGLGGEGEVEDYAVKIVPPTSVAGMTADTAAVFGDRPIDADPTASALDGIRESAPSLRRSAYRVLNA